MNRRKNTRLQNYDYSSPGAYFITLVTRSRAPLFGRINHGQIIDSQIGSVARKEWHALPKRIPGIKLDLFILMPNHLHGIIWLTDGNSLPLSRIIAFYKAGVSRICHQSIWQYNFHERVIRDERELYFARQYIEQNPLRWELDRYYPAG
ncbi:transposase [Pantoea trifolii]|uniref:transposase n=1 Tax=Candidatus Pantoea symbiotica TaxID=1884370 RepID=UPI002412F048|nr:transposase [Pantoea rodasii]MDY0925962.1 transposase [Enterobacter sp. CFBP8995]